MRNFLEKTSLFILQNIPTLVFFLIPLFFLTNTIDFFTFNKFYLLSLLASISLVFWCINNIFHSRISITLSPAFTALFILVVTHICSAFFMSPTKVLSLTGVTTLFSALFIIFFTFTSTTPNIKVIKRQIFALILSVTLISLVTILHFFNLIAPLFASEIFKSKYLNLTGGIVPALAFSIPILVGILSYIYFTEKLKTKIFLFFVSGIIIAACVINISLILPSNGVSPIVSLPLRASWSVALDIFKFPGTALIGSGPETYMTTFTRLRPSYLNNSTNLWNIRFTESGSFFLTLLTTVGLIGGLSFLFAFLKNISLGIKSFSESDIKPELSFLIVSLIGFLVSFCFTSGGIVGIAVGILLLGTITQVFKKSEHKLVKNLRFNLSNEDFQNKTLSSFLPIFSLIISLALLATYWTFGARFYKATLLLNEARQKVSTDIAGSFLKQSEAQKLNVYDATYQLVMSQTYQQVALFYLQKKEPVEQDKKNAIETMQRAIDSGKRAATLDPFNVMVWENLSNVYQSFIGAAEGAENLAISHLAQAISLDPTNPRLRLQLGILYYNLNDKVQALKLINQAQELKPNWEMPYLNLYSYYMEAKDFQRAKANLEQVVSLTSPQSPDYEKLQAELKKLTSQIAPNSTSSALPK